jgi:hypothetical protein
MKEAQVQVRSMLFQQEQGKTYLTLVLHVPKKYFLDCQWFLFLWSVCHLLTVPGVLEELRDKSVISGWRNELYPVTSSFYAKPELLVSASAITQN